MDIHRVYGVFLKYFRSKRLKQFRALFPEHECSTILDLGGSPYQWDLLNYRSKITILNKRPPKPSSPKPPKYSFVVADACNSGFPDQSFDLVFSNSVIEHVGGSKEQGMFAQEMLRIGKHIYCQTPNKHFFVEPHLIAPFIHYLPVNWQMKLVRYFSIWGIVVRPTPQDVKEFLSLTRLLTKNELIKLFPNCEIITERFLFMPKSYIVIKRK